MKITPNPPKSARELEQFYLQTIKKLEGTDTTLADEEKKSISPLIGMTQDLGRKIETLVRDTRNLKGEIESLKRIEQENRTLRAAISALTKRIDDIEGAL